MKLHQVEQNTPEWKQARLGIPTASNFHYIITPLGKPVDSRERKSYLYRLTAERILNVPMPERFQGNEWTERGTQLEDRAANELAKRLNRTFEPGGFITTDDGRFGCSPDRIIVGKHGSEAVEIKAPAAWTHIQYMVEGPGERYKPQVQGQILCGGFWGVHFWSFHPDFAPVHVYTLPDSAYLAKLQNLLNLFNSELETTVDWVKRQGNVEEVVLQGMERIDQPEE